MAGWAKDPANCALADIHTYSNATEDLILTVDAFEEFVESMGTETLVCENFKLLVSILLSYATETEKTHCASILYSRYVDYLQSNYSLNSICNPIKLLHLDNVPHEVLCRRYQLPEGATRLALLHRIATAMGLR